MERKFGGQFKWTGSDGALLWKLRRVRSRGGPCIEGGAGRLLRKGAVGGVRASAKRVCWEGLCGRLSPGLCGWLREVSLVATSPAAAARARTGVMRRQRRRKRRA